MSDLNSDVNKTKMKPSNIEEDAVYTKEMRRKDTIEKLERDYNGIFTEPEKMEKEFPKFYKKERKTHPSERGWDVSDTLTL